jgi:hypothetical protein
MLSILHLFYGLGAALEIRTARTFSWLEFGQTSLILLGNSKTNSVLKAFEGGMPFVLNTRQIELREPSPSERAVYRDSRFIDGNMERMTAHALVTRRPGPTPESAVTMIAANHCRGLEGAGYFLTQEDKVRGVLEMIATHDGVLPKCFQILLRIDTVDTTREVVNAECVAYRLFDRTRGSAPGPRFNGNTRKRFETILELKA